MQRKSCRHKSAFTLLEIMIVVAVIAILAAIAVPNFMRSRKRAQAVSILEEMRVLDEAKTQFAAESSSNGTAPALAGNVARYIKHGTPLYVRLAGSPAATEVNDIIGNPIALGSLDQHPTVSPATLSEFEDIIPPEEQDAFWGPYKPDADTTL